MGMNPLDVLLRSRRREPATMRLLWVGTACIVLGIGIPEYAGLRGLPDAASVTLFTLALIMLVVFPFVSAGSDAAVLEAMKRGRFLADLQLTGMTPRHIVDGLMERSVLRVFKVGLGFYLIFVTYFEMEWVTSPLPYKRPGESLVMALWWLPLLMLASVAISYMGQMHALWKTADTWSSAHHAVIWPLAFVASMPLCWMMVWHPEHAVWGVVMALVGLAVGSRALALFRLEHLDDLHQKGRPFWKAWRPSGSNPWLRPWSANPIVVREAAMAASRVPGGLPGVLIWLCGGALLSVGVIFAVPQLTADDRFLLLAFGLPLLQIARVTCTCMESVMRERQGNTLVLVQQTPMLAGEFVDGWVVSAVLPRAVETVLAGVPLVLWAATAGTGAFVSALIGLAMVLVHLFTAAYAAIGISARLKDRSYAGLSLVGMGWIYLLLLGLPSGFLPLAVFILWPPSFFGVALHFLRDWAIAGIKDTVDQVGFVPLG